MRVCLCGGPSREQSWWGGEGPSSKGQIMGCGKGGGDDSGKKVEEKMRDKIVVLSGIIRELCVLCLCALCVCV